MPHVTFIHGSGNKPPKVQLLQDWEHAIDQSGTRIALAQYGVTTSMVYWADVMYAEPQSIGEGYESVSDDMEKDDEDDSWRQVLEGDQRLFVDSLANTLRMDVPSPNGDDFEPLVSELGLRFESIPLPWFIKRRMMRALLKALHHYLFDAKFSPRPDKEFQVQDHIRQRFVDQLTSDTANREGPHVVVSHGMGTVIAYDCLKHLPDCPKVDGLMTIGSPLGLDEIQGLLQQDCTRRVGYPSERLNGHWVNVYDRLDPIAGVRPRLANYYQQDGNPVVQDVDEQNHGKWRHNVIKYLGGTRLGESLEDLLYL